MRIILDHERKNLKKKLKYLLQFDYCIDSTAPSWLIRPIELVSLLKSIDSKDSLKDSKDSIKDSKE